MQRSKHSLSHYNLASCNMGTIVPIGLVEVLPGDSFRHATSAFIRAMPLATPVMHPVHAKIHHWFVPHRLVWENWEDFITGGPDGMDDSVFPTITSPAVTGFPVGSLADKLGITPEVPDLEVSALPFRAYNLIYNKYYRDQDLTPEVPIEFGDGNDTTTSVALQQAAWEKDYFTSSRPWEQKGPSISVPLTGDAPVTGIGILQSNTTYTNAPGNLTDATGDTVTYPGAKALFGSTGAGVYVETDRTSGTGAVPLVEADLSGVTAVDMNDLRVAMALQRYEEARARWGSEYVDYLNYLGVKSSDARLQRPEYLGGGKQTIQFSEVLQTAPGDDPVGEMKGHGLGVMRSNRYMRFFEEHGYVMSFLVIRPVAIYSSGVPRHMLYRSKEDFWQKELEHVGQQGVLNAEVYAAHAQPLGVWSYQDRYDQYRRQPSMISSEMRTLLDSWNIARIFETPPVLNDAFVKCDPSDRIFASQSTDQFVAFCRHSLQARRLISKVGSSYIY